MVLDTLANLLGDKEPKPNKFTIAMGEIIRKAREESNLSQSELAELVYRRRATITDIENGKHETDVTTLALIAAAVNKPISYLIPKSIRKYIPGEDLSPNEQALIMEFRQLQLEDLEQVAIKQVHALAEFDSYKALSNVVDLAKEENQIHKDLESILKRKSRG